MPDYSKGKIYTIRFINDSNIIYIGSTCQPLAKRFGGHKRDLRCSLYKYIQDVYYNDWSKCYIELYEDFKADNKEHLNKREGEIIRDFMNNDRYIVINRCIAGRTDKEYKKDNKEKIKQYYETNKEDILNNAKKYYETNKDKKKEYRQANKDKIKQYYEANKDKIKEYEQNNKDKRNKKKRERYEANKAKQEAEK